MKQEFIIKELESIVKYGRENQNYYENEGKKYKQEADKAMFKDLDVIRGLNQETMQRYDEGVASGMSRVFDQIEDLINFLKKQ